MIEFANDAYNEKVKLKAARAENERLREYIRKHSDDVNSAEVQFWNRDGRARVWKMSARSHRDRLRICIEALAKGATPLIQDLVDKEVENERLRTALEGVAYDMREWKDGENIALDQVREVLK